MGQILSNPFKEWVGLKWANLICYFFNVVCLSFLTLFYAFFNINDLNTHYSVNDYFILILIWVFIYIFTSISSLLIYEVCLDYTKELIRKFFFENLKIKFFKKREKKIISSVLFFLMLLLNH